ncbi:Zinc finger CCHC-type containing 14 [Balamuthia mandrillaris]
MAQLMDQTSTTTTTTTTTGMNSSSSNASTTSSTAKRSRLRLSWSRNGVLASPPESSSSQQPQVDSADQHLKRGEEDEEEQEQQLEEGEEEERAEENDKKRDEEEDRREASNVTPETPRGRRPRSDREGVVLSRSPLIDSNSKRHLRKERHKSAASMSLAGTGGDAESVTPFLPSAASTSALVSSPTVPVSSSSASFPSTIVSSVSSLQQHPQQEHYHHHHQQQQPQQRTSNGFTGQTPSYRRSGGGLSALSGTGGNSRPGSSSYHDTPECPLGPDLELLSQFKAKEGHYARSMPGATCPFQYIDYSKSSVPSTPDLGPGGRKEHATDTSSINPIKLSEDIAKSYKKWYNDMVLKLENKKAETKALRYFLLPFNSVKDISLTSSSRKNHKSTIGPTASSSSSSSSSSSTSNTTSSSTPSGTSNSNNTRESGSTIKRDKETGAPPAMSVHTSISYSTFSKQSSSPALMRENSEEHTSKAQSKEDSKGESRLRSSRADSAKWQDGGRSPALGLNSSATSQQPSSAQLPKSQPGGIGSMVGGYPPPLTSSRGGATGLPAAGGAIGAKAQKQKQMQKGSPEHYNNSHPPSHSTVSLPHNSTEGRTDWAHVNYSGDNGGSGCSSGRPPPGLKIPPPLPLPVPISTPSNTSLPSTATMTSATSTTTATSSSSSLAMSGRRSAGEGERISPRHSSRLVAAAGAGEWDGSGGSGGSRDEKKDKKKGSFAFKRKKKKKEDKADASRTGEAGEPATLLQTI